MPIILHVAIMQTPKIAAQLKTAPEGAAFALTRDLGLNDLAYGMIWRDAPAIKSMDTLCHSRRGRYGISARAKHRSDRVPLATAYTKYSRINDVSSDVDDIG